MVGAAAVRGEDRELLGRFDAFGDGCDAERTSHCDDRAHDTKAEPTAVPSSAV